MIAESVAHAATRAREVVFDAEHFFDGWKANRDYALSCLEAAHKGGARWLVLCDTNGGTLPDEIETIVRDASTRVPASHLGIHCHDDTGNAVANSLAAVRAGTRMIQGTLNGLGERCGNANLTSIIPTLLLKPYYAERFTTAVTPERLSRLRDASRLLDEIGLTRRDRRGVRLLDLATGTGDQILNLLDAGADLAEVVGMDMSEAMLARGREKLRIRGLGDRITMRTGDATRVPADAGSFDAVTMAFGIRNVGDVPRALDEMRRVLRPGGRALILEFSLPGAPLLRAGYLFYLRHFLPAIGGCLSGDARAYRYLNRTIEAFPYGDAFCGLMRAAGFVEVTSAPLTCGIATIYKGDKPQP